MRVRPDVVLVVVAIAVLALVAAFVAAFLSFHGKAIPSEFSALLTGAVPTLAALLAKTSREPAAEEPAR